MLFNWIKVELKTLRERNNNTYLVCILNGTLVNDICLVRFYVPVKKFPKAVIAEILAIKSV